MRNSDTPSSRRKEEFRAEVREALRRLADVAFLTDSPLAELPAIREKWWGNTAYFAPGQALRDFLIQVLDDIIQRLPAEGTRITCIRLTLDGFRRSESIAAVARRAGRSREHWSRHYAAQAVNLVADEVWLRTRGSKLKAS